MQVTKARRPKRKPQKDTIPAGLPAQKRKSGVAVIGDLPWGFHLCQFYKTKKDLLEILVPYFRAGLENNEYCMWITSEPLSAEEAARALKKAVPNFRKFARKGQIEIIPYSKWYLKVGRFDARRVLKGWVSRHDQALKQGYEGLRLTGNTFWLEKKDWRKFTQYEEMINKTIGSYRMIGLCTYCLDRCGAMEVIDVVRNHQFALINREGSWETIESSELRRGRSDLKEAEAKYQIVADNTYDFEFWIDPNGKYLYASPSSERITGHRPEDFIADPGLRRRIVHPDDRATFDKHLHEIEEGKVAGEVEYRIIDSKGLIRWMSHVCRPVFDKDGAFVGVRGSNREVTERKKAEEALRKSDERYRALFQGLPVSTVIFRKTDHDFVVTEYNKASMELTGGKMPEFVGRSASELYRSRPDILEKFAEVSEKKTSRTVETPYQLVSTGRKIFMKLTLAHVPPDSVMVHTEDLTESVLTEQTTRSLSRFPGENPNPVIRIMSDGIVQYANPASLALEGWNLKIDGPAPQPLIALISPALKQGRPIEREITVAGRVWWVTAVPIVSESYVNIYGRDITDRKKAEETLRQTGDYLEKLLTYANAPVICWDSKFRVTLFNRAFEKLAGRKAEEVIGKNLSILFPRESKDESLDKIRRTLIGERWEVVEIPILRKGGSVRTVLWNSANIYSEDGKTLLATIAQGQDITERKAAESELKKAHQQLEKKVRERTSQLTRINQELIREIEERTRIEDALRTASKELLDAKRLSDIGTLAATVAHELRNPLAAMRMATYNIKKKAQNPLLERHLETIDKKIDESDQIINNLIFYSRLRVPHYEQVDIYALVNECIRIAKKRFSGKAVTIKKNLKPLKGVLIESDSLQTQEVFTNVLNNAFDAIADGGGKIEIDSGLTRESVRVSISDTGSGLDEELVSRVFEPFFTTKAKGTGLGLTVCKQIIDLHGGTIGIQSQKSKGTTVTIILPKSRRRDGKENPDH